MASLRSRARADGTTAHAVLYEVDGQQTSATFDTLPAAEEFRDAVNTIGAERAMKGWGIAPTKRAARRPSGPTVGQWLRKYIDSRTGVTKATLFDYESYLRNDITTDLGAIPLSVLSRDDVATWVQTLADRELSGKTIANRHGFLSAALNQAAHARLLEFNPALGTRLPRTEGREKVFLDHDEFDILRGCLTERWRPLLDFMVTSGMRFGELSALRPGDVDQGRGTVHVARAWKRTYDSTGYEIGVPKTKRSVRTVNVDKDVLKALDYSGEYLFTNTAGNPLRAPSFRNNVWYPAVAKAKKKGLKKSPRIHDMRHTCASWMVQGGESLAVVQVHLGHESINTTISLYAHIDRKTAEAAAERLGKVMKRPASTGAPVPAAPSNRR